MISGVFAVPVYPFDEDGREIDWIEPVGFRYRLSMPRMSDLISDKVYKSQDGAHKAAGRFLHMFPHTDWEFC